MSELELKYIRFVVQTERNAVQRKTQQLERNEFDIMIEHSHKPYFPSTKIENTQWDILYYSTVERKSKRWLEYKSRTGRQHVY